MSQGSDEYEGAGTPDPYEAVVDPDDEADRYDVSDAIDPIDQGDPATDEVNLYDTSWVPPDREPSHLKWGTTLAEEREGEPLDRRLAEEEPDVLDRLDDGADESDEYDEAEAEPQPRAGRLVADDEGVHPVEEKDLVARDAGIAGAGASAEEAAVHLINEPPPPAPPSPPHPPRGGGTG